MVVLALLAATALAAPAQLEPLGYTKECGFVGADPCWAFKTPDATCLVYPRYLVWSKSGGEADSGWFMATPLGDAKPTERASRALCAKGQPGDQAHNGFAGYLTGLARDFAIVDHGTSTGDRSLSVINLVSGQSIYSTSYRDSPQVYGHQLRFWRRDEKETATPDRCPKYRKEDYANFEYDIVVLRRYEFNLKARKEDASDITVCRGRD